MWKARMSSTLLSALAKLDESVRVLEERLQCLGAGLEVSKDQFTQNLREARQNADAVRELVRAKSPDVDWTDRQALEKLIRDLEAAEAGRKELRLGRLLELAEELSAGTITHRLKSRVTALGELREAAVRELLAEAAEDQPKDLPGPDAFAWMQWACGSQGNANAAQFSELEKDFPALVRFAGEMEESYWQPRESSHEIPEEVAIDEPSSIPQAPIQSPTSPLSESAPAFAARYGHLSAAKADRVETAAPTNTVAAAVEQAPDDQASKSSLPATPDSRSDVARMLAAVAAHRVNRPVPIEGSAQVLAEGSAAPAEAAPAEPIPFTFQSFPVADAESVEEELKHSRFSLNRSVLFTVGAIALIVLVMVVISAMSGNLTGKRGSPPPATVASDSAKESSAASSEAPVSDLELVGQIEQRLKAIEGSSIYVTVQHGTAILEGQVPSEEALATAEELTLQSKQIKIIRNRIQIAKVGALPSTNRPAKPNPASAE
jgi:BON domain